jgi:hypothetical protein
MSTAVHAVAGLLLIAHGLVHLLYLAPDVTEFDPQRSWIVPTAARRPVSVALMVATVGAFALLGLAVWGVPVVRDAWPAIAVAASLCSLLLLGAFWNARLLFGVTIDAAVLMIAWLEPPWSQDLLG